MEKTQGADLPVKLDRIEPRPEYNCFNATNINARDVIDSSQIKVPYDLGLLEIYTLVDILDHHGAVEYGLQTLEGLAVWLEG